MSNMVGEEGGDAICVYHGPNGIEVLGIRFVEGVNGFTKWAETKLESSEMVTGTEITPLGYDPTTQANLFVTYNHGSYRLQYNYATSEMAWTYLKTLAEKQERPRQAGSGRPAALVMQLQSWRKWQRKVGARY